MIETASSPRTHYFTFAALLILLVVTVAVAQVDLGPLNVVTALGVAALKTFLIAVYFMHLQTARSSVRVFAVVGVMWLIMLLGLLLNDYATRPLVPGAASSHHVDPDAL